MKSNGKNKAQITLFIIIALAIISAMIASFYLLKSRGVKTQATFEDHVENINAYVSSCLDATSISAVYLVGLQGGYTTLPINKPNFEEMSMAYLYYEGEDLTQSIKEIEKEISVYIENNIDVCTNNFDYFLEQGLEIKKGSPSIETIIQPDKVITKATYEIAIKKDERFYLLSDFTSSITARLGIIYNVTKNIVKEEVTSPDYIGINNLLDTKLNITLIPYSNDTIIYMITDGDVFDDTPYLFMFANKFAS